MEPEQAIVLQTLTGAVQDVAKAAGKIPGLEWLAKADLDEAAIRLCFGPKGETIDSRPNDNQSPPSYSLRGLFGV